MGSFITMPDDYTLKVLMSWNWKPGKRMLWPVKYTDLSSTLARFRRDFPKTSQSTGWITCKSTNSKTKILTGYTVHSLGYHMPALVEKKYYKWNAKSSNLLLCSVDSRGFESMLILYCINTLSTCDHPPVWTDFKVSIFIIQVGAWCTQCSTWKQFV